MFNPFSVLNAFFSKEFGNYWFQTGTPTFLVELLKESDYDLRLLMDGIETAASAFTEYRADRKNPIPLIYQSGYLTIKDYDKRFKMYRLGFLTTKCVMVFLTFYYHSIRAVTDEERSFISVSSSMNWKVAMLTLSCTALKLSLQIFLTS